MESGDLPLEESVAQFEEASSLIKYCQQKLDEYKGKVEAITIAEERKGEKEERRTICCFTMETDD